MQAASTVHMKGFHVISIGSVELSQSDDVMCQWRRGKNKLWGSVDPTLSSPKLSHK